MTAQILMALVTLFLSENSEIGGQMQKVAARELGNPEEDASRAIATGDFSLRGVVRFVVFVPGIDGDYEILRRNFNIVVIEGTSGVIVIDPESFDRRAERYAFTYNRYIFRKLGCNFMKPMDKCENYP